MNKPVDHLTDEQFEDQIQCVEFISSHLDDCVQCRRRLAEKKALAGRPRLVYYNIKAPARLLERICQHLNSHRKLCDGRHLLRARSLRRIWFETASVAAVLMIALSALLFFGEPATALAARAELVSIHEDNVSAMHGFYSQNNPEKVADYFKSELGVRPIIPQIRQGQSLRGCCLCRFKGQMASSYVVDTPQGLMSIVVVSRRPQSMGMRRSFRQGKHTFWAGSYTRYKLVAVRIGQYSYCAIGAVPDTQLTQLLVQLVPNQQY